DSHEWSASFARTSHNVRVSESLIVHVVGNAAAADVDAAGEARVVGHEADETIWRVDLIVVIPDGHVRSTPRPGTADDLLVAGAARGASVVAADIGKSDANTACELWVVRKERQ